MDLMTSKTGKCSGGRLYDHGCLTLPKWVIYPSDVFIRLPQVIICLMCFLNYGIVHSGTSCQSTTIWLHCPLWLDIAGLELDVAVTCSFLDVALVNWRQHSNFADTVKRKLLELWIIEAGLHWHSVWLPVTRRAPVTRGPQVPRGPPVTHGPRSPAEPLSNAGLGRPL